MFTDVNNDEQNGLNDIIYYNIKPIDFKDKNINYRYTNNNNNNTSMNSSDIISDNSSINNNNYSDNSSISMDNNIGSSKNIKYKTENDIKNELKDHANLINIIELNETKNIDIQNKISKVIHRTSHSDTNYLKYFLRIMDEFENVYHFNDTKKLQRINAYLPKYLNQPQLFDGFYNDFGKHNDILSKYLNNIDCDKESIKLQYNIPDKSSNNINLTLYQLNSDINTDIPSHVKSIQEEIKEHEQHYIDTIKQHEIKRFITELDGKLSFCNYMDALNDNERKAIKNDELKVKRMLQYYYTLKHYKINNNNNNSNIIIPFDIKKFEETLKQKIETNHHKNLRYAYKKIQIQRELNGNKNVNLNKIRNDIENIKRELRLFYYHLGKFHDLSMKFGLKNLHKLFENVSQMLRRRNPNFKGLIWDKMIKCFQVYGQFKKIHDQYNELNNIRDTNTLNMAYKEYTKLNNWYKKSETYANIFNQITKQMILYLKYQHKQSKLYQQKMQNNNQNNNNNTNNNGNNHVNPP